MLFSRFDTESSLWGPFLSVVNEEQARQSDRRYWSLSSDGTALTEGVHTLTHTSHIIFSAGSYFALLLWLITVPVLPSGANDFKIEEAQKITIQNKSY